MLYTRDLRRKTIQTSNHDSAFQTDEFALGADFLAVSMVGAAKSFITFLTSKNYEI